MAGKGLETTGTTGPATADVSLTTRRGLPEGLGALLAQHPRAGWETHPELGPLTRFWLDRHLGFRDTLSRLRSNAEAVADGAMDPEAHATHLSRIGGAFLQHLHGHHSIEDAHYFPRLLRLAPSLERGFTILDADHHRLHEELDTFASKANAAIRARDVSTSGTLADHLTELECFLDRHLLDEEDLVVPIILDVGEDRVG